MANEPGQVFQLKGGLYPLTTLQLLTENISALAEPLTEKIKQAPKFFENAPLIIDVQKLNKPEIEIDFLMLKSILKTKSLVPVGVKSANPEQQVQAIKAGFAIIQESIKESSVQASHGAKSESGTNSYPPELGKSVENHVPKTEKGSLQGQTPSTDYISASNTRLITEPVRSGQQLYARGGDLVIIGSVSQGAELLADGNIHVYGTLRGRALAGVTGDTQARIFCQSLEAELISIAGHYKISEDIEQAFWREFVDISFTQGRLHIQPL